MRRHELSDAPWELITSLMPRSGRRGGGRWRDHRQVVNGLMWQLAPGAHWRDLPERCGPWRTVHERFSRWRGEGLFDRVSDQLRPRLKPEGLSDLDLWCIDSTSVRASPPAAGAGRRGLPRSPSTTRSASREEASAPRSPRLLGNPRGSCSHRAAPRRRSGGLAGYGGLHGVPVHLRAPGRLFRHRARADERAALSRDEWPGWSGRAS